MEGGRPRAGGSARLSKGCPCLGGASSEPPQGPGSLFGGRRSPSCLDWAHRGPGPEKQAPLLPLRRRRRAGGRLGHPQSTPCLRGPSRPERHRPSCEPVPAQLLREGTWAGRPCLRGASHSSSRVHRAPLPPSATKLRGTDWLAEPGDSWGPETAALCTQPGPCSRSGGPWGRRGVRGGGSQEQGQAGPGQPASGRTPAAPECPPRPGLLSSHPHGHRPACHPGPRANPRLVSRPPPRRPRPWAARHRAGPGTVTSGCGPAPPPPQADALPPSASASGSEAERGRLARSLPASALPPHGPEDVPGRPGGDARRTEPSPPRGVSRRPAEPRHRPGGRECCLGGGFAATLWQQLTATRPSLSSRSRSGGARSTRNPVHQDPAHRDPAHPRPRPPDPARPRPRPPRPRPAQPCPP